MTFGKYMIWVIIGLLIYLGTIVSNELGMENGRTYGKLECIDSIVRIHNQAEIQQIKMDLEAINRILLELKYMKEHQSK